VVGRCRLQLLKDDAFSQNFCAALELHGLRQLFVVLACLGHDNVDVSLAAKVVPDGGLGGPASSSAATAAAPEAVGARALSCAGPECMQQR